MDPTQSNLSIIVTPPDWKNEIMRLWRTHSNRPPTASEIASFRLLLNTSDAHVQDRLAAQDEAQPTAHFGNGWQQNPIVSPELRAGHTWSPPDSPGQIQAKSKDSCQQHSHGDDPNSSTMAHASCPTRPFWGTTDVVVPAAILKYIEADIQKRNAKGCGFSQGASSTRKSFLCTLGCGRFLASSCDRRRHEETIYPQDYWACYECAHSHSARGSIYHRLDKIQKHSNDKHANTLSIDRCKLGNIPVAIPQVCALCQYHFINQTDRERHLEHDHSGRQAQVIDLRDSQNYLPGDDVQSTSHSDTDMHDVVDEAAEVATSEAVISSMATLQSYPSWTGSKLSYEAPHLNAEGLGLSSRISSVTLRRLAVGPKLLPQLPTLHFVAVQWLGTSTEMSGEATVFKAEIAFDLDQGRPSTPRRYMVKQYALEHRYLFDQELEIFARMSEEDNTAAIVSCFGTFEDVDTQGQTTYNILLEHADSNLWEFWTNTPSPTSSLEIAEFYFKLFNVTSGLKALQRLRGTQAAGLTRPKCLFRANITPKDIVCMSNPGSGLLGGLKMNLQLEYNFMYTSDNSIYVVVWFVSIEVATQLACGDGALLQPSVLSQVAAVVEMQMLGQVFSLAATWVTSGSGNSHALEDSPLSIVSAETGLMTMAPIDSQAKFLNTANWHNHLRTRISKEDKITGSLLDIVDKFLLPNNTAYRLDASQLRAMLEQLLRQVETEGPAGSGENLAVGSTGMAAINHRPSYHARFPTSSSMGLGASISADMAGMWTERTWDQWLLD